MFGLGHRNRSAVTSLDWESYPILRVPANPGVNARGAPKYQARAQQEGVDALGYHIASWGYAQLQVLQQAVETAKSVDDDKLADCILLELQFQHIRGNDLGQFKDISTQVVLVPVKYKSGDVIYPYEMAK